MLKQGLARLPALLLVGTGAAMLAFTLNQLLLPEQVEAEPPLTGMERLDAFRCRLAETKTVELHGVADDFSGEGEELASGYSPAMGPNLELQFVGEADFDGQQMDAYLHEHFAIEGELAAAQLVFSIRPNANNANDLVSLNVVSSQSSESRERSQMLSVALLLVELPGDPAWSVQDEDYAVDLAQVTLPSGETVIEALNAQPRPAYLDVIIGDDTSVDYLALASCAMPPRDHGLTFALFETGSIVETQVVSFDCHSPGAQVADCDPYRGDMLCRAALPLLCFEQLNRPYRAGLLPSSADVTDSSLHRRWSGGRVAATEAVRGDRFATVGEADALCVARFGEGWRVADFHTGNVGWGFAASGNPDDLAGRYWVDIKDRPYGTCWNRTP